MVFDALIVMLMILGGGGGGVELRPPPVQAQNIRATQRARIERRKHAAQGCAGSRKNISEVLILKTEQRIKSLEQSSRFF